MTSAGNRIIGSAKEALKLIKTQHHRVLVCGGRDFLNDKYAFNVLDFVHDFLGPIDVIIQGGARGADTLAKLWAEDRNVKCEQYDADWDGLGKKAGPIRNKQMLEEGKPDLVVAFRGGSGTAHMVRIASRKKLPVLYFYGENVSHEAL